MRRPILILALFFVLGAAASAATGKVLKVLPQFIDLKGRTALSPSLYDRDAYQAHLREHTNEISGVRFAVQWKASGATNGVLRVRVELRGIAHGDLPPSLILEEPVKPGLSLLHYWSYLRLAGDDYKRLGEVTAWRATLWDGDKIIGEQKSFLW